MPIPSSQFSWPTWWYLITSVELRGTGSANSSGRICAPGVFQVCDPEERINFEPVEAGMGKPLKPLQICGDGLYSFLKRQSPFMTVFHLLSYLLQRYLRHWNAEHTAHADLTYLTPFSFPWSNFMYFVLKQLIILAPRGPFVIIIPNRIAKFGMFIIIFPIRIAIYSQNWMTGKFTGNPYIWWWKPWFPVSIFPNKPIHWFIACSSFWKSQP